MSKKQLLIIEDLGIPHEVFENTANGLGLDYNIIWDINLAESDTVEILVNVKKKIDESLINRFPNLKMIGVAFTGYDSVDVETCKRKGIAVYNVPAYSTQSVAELAVGLAIALLREIPKADWQIRQNKWELRPGNDLNGKVVGILGTGAIGLATAKIFKAIGCPLIGWSRTEKEELKNLGGIYFSDLKEFFAAADIISIHIPSNPNTRGLVGEHELRAMKKTAYLINTARGPIVDENALFGVLKNKEIAGAGLDVFSIEPIPHNHPFLSLDNVILTPHIAYKTEEALERRANVTLQNIRSYLQGVSKNRVG
ncbi:MAG: hypothetical protein J5I50_05265 [Chitinophagaceae bacterium]|nr:hypothetical protein [Chitinophagaceae bacterium]